MVRIIIWSEATLFGLLCRSVRVCADIYNNVPAEFRENSKVLIAFQHMILVLYFDKKKYYIYLIMMKGYNFELLFGL